MVIKIVFLENKIQTGFLKFKLFETETAQAFFEAITNTTCISTSCNHNVTRNKLEVVNDYLRLKEIVRLINNTSYDRKITIDLDSELTQQKLFDLHEEFELLGERKRSNDPTLSDQAYEEVIELGCEMNNLIHKFESNLFGGRWMQATFAQPNVHRIPLNDKIISEATRDYKKGLLYVGYGETGKNMEHIHTMNEVDLLERKMVQPQRYILSEFFLPFDDKIMDYEDYKNWCIKNNAEEKGYDFENPIWYGTWEVGIVIERSFHILSEFPIHDTIQIEIEPE